MARKRNRKQRQSIGFDLQPVVRCQPSGQARRTAKDTDPAHAALVTRCKMAGLDVTPANLREVRHPMYGCRAGRAIAGHPDYLDLWDAICHMRRTVAAYDRACGAPSRHAKCLALLLPLDELHADASTPPTDLRSDTERYTQAVTAWRRLHGWLDRDKLAAGETMRAVIDDAEQFSYTALLSGLRLVVRGIKGEL